MTWEYLIGSEKDFEGAPDWCTHVSKGSVSFFWEMSHLIVKGNKFQLKGCHGVVSFYDDTNSIGEKLEIVAQRRKRESIQWGGVGLPPVGCECEALIPYLDEKYSKWRKVKVILHGDEFDAAGELIVVDLENSHPCWTDAFRPLRTKEQIERDDAVKEITGLIEATPWRKWEKIAECIFDAGYRKTK